LSAYSSALDEFNGFKQPDGLGLGLDDRLTLRWAVGLIPGFNMVSFAWTFYSPVSTTIKSFDVSVGFELFSPSV